MAAFTIAFQERRLACWNSPAGLTAGYGALEAPAWRLAVFCADPEKRATDERRLAPAPPSFSRDSGRPFSIPGCRTPAKRKRVCTGLSCGVPNACICARAPNVIISIPAPAPPRVKRVFLCLCCVSGGSASEHLRIRQTGADFGSIMGDYAWSAVCTDAPLERW